MAWTYTDDPKNVPVDKVRFLCGDTDSEDPLLSDGEIEYLLESAGNAESAARKACMTIIAKLAREVDYVIGPEQVRASQRLENYRKLLALLPIPITTSTGTPIWGTPGSEFRDPIFDIGLHDVPGNGSGLDG